MTPSENSRYLHYIAVLGLFFAACVCFLCSCLLLFAGGTAIKDYVISILPGDGGINPPGIGEYVVTASTKTVFKVPICDMSNSSCSLKDMPLNTWTAVKPGVSENRQIPNGNLNLENHDSTPVIKRGNGKSMKVHCK